MKKLLKLPKRAGKYVITVGAKVKIYFRSLQSFLTLEIKKIEGPYGQELKLEEDEIKHLLESCCSDSSTTDSVKDSPQLLELKKIKVQLKIENGIISYLYQNKITYSLCKFLKAIKRTPAAQN